MFLMRDRAEKVVEYHHYPEPDFISRRRRLAWHYRFWLGRPLDNVRWTNSTWSSSASRGEASWWLRLSGRSRMLLRALLVWSALMLLIYAPLLTLAFWSAVSSRWPALSAWAVSAMLNIGLAHLLVAAPVLILIQLRAIRAHGLRVPVLQRVMVELENPATPPLELADRSHAERIAIAEKLEQREQRGKLTLTMTTVIEGQYVWLRDVVQPLAMALADSLDNIYRPGDLDWIHVPRNYLEPGGGKVEVLLPTGFSGSMAAKKLILEKTIANKLGMLDPVFEWQVSGRKPRVLVSMPPAPPKVAHFRDYRALLEQTEEFRPFLGVSAVPRGEDVGALVSAEMVSDSPHVALSAGSGAGKSMMSKAMIMQALRWGWGVIILDWKAESHTWAKGLPGVKYCVTEEAIHDTLVSIGEQVDIRKTNGMQGRANVLVVCEEWNMTAVLLAEYWSALRSMADQDERRTMPTRSPALRGFGSLVFAGRQFGLFCLLIAQRMSNRVFNGNTDLRENFQIRLLARYSAQTWRMLIPEMKPIRKPKELGRWVVFAQDEVTHVQGILVTDDEAREYSTGGLPNPTTPFGITRVPEPDATSDDIDILLDDQVASDAARRNAPQLEPAPRPMAKLVDISATLDYLGITHNVLRNAARSDSRGDPTFPAAVGGDQFSGYLYDVVDVKEWARRKRAAEAARKEVR
jgi:hypothetical protein